MLATNILQQVYDWLPTLGRLSSNTTTPTVDKPICQLLLQPGDFYFLDEGSYQLRVLAGQLWVPEQGIFAAGEFVHLLSDRQGLTLRTADDRPAVFAISAR